MKKRISIIVQLTNKCNLNCVYCYVHASKINEFTININEIEKLITNCVSCFDEIQFCWHGGEPLLLPIDFFNNIVEIQEKISKKNQITFKNVIQTNGTIFNDEILNFLKINKFGIGTSFDAPDYVNDKTRLYCDETSINYIHSKFIDNLSKLNIEYNPLCVITKLNVNKGEEIFHYFSSKGATSYSLLNAMNTIENDLIPSNDEIFNLYKTTFNLWLQEKHNFASIQPIETMVKSLLGEKPMFCSYSASCLKRMITILSNGNIVPCGSFVESNYILGNIFNETLIKVLSSKKCNEFRNLRTAHIHKHCRSCDYISICRGGCREAAFWANGKYDGEYPYCDARKRTFEYMRQKLQNLMDN